VNDSTSVPSCYGMEGLLSSRTSWKRFQRNSVCIASTMSLTESPLCYVCLLLVDIAVHRTSTATSEHILASPFGWLSGLSTGDSLVTHRRFESNLGVATVYTPMASTQSVFCCWVASIRDPPRRPTSVGRLSIFGQLSAAACQTCYARGSSNPPVRDRS
jgi:hypothetical protein